MTADLDMSPAAADAFTTDVRQILESSSPDFNLSEIAKLGQARDLLSAAEAEKLSLYAIFPNWLHDRLSEDLCRPPAMMQPAPLLPTASTDLSPPKGSARDGSLLAEFRPGRTWSPLIARIDGGRSVHYVANFRKLSWNEEGVIGQMSNSNARHLLPYLEAAVPVALDGRTFLAVVEGSAVYTHWILDTLPRLLLVLETEGSLDDYDHFLFATNQTQFHRFTLDLLGIAPTRQVTRQAQGTLFSVRAFTHVSAPRNQFAAHPHIYDAVAGLFLSDASPLMQTRRLYISRNKASRRRIINEDAVRAILEARGFETLHLEDLSIRETALTFREASHVVAAHGAGLANLVFCQPSTRVMEIYAAHLSQEYWMISNQRGLEYFGFEACAPDGNLLEPSDRSAMGFFARNGLDIHVPADLFRLVLDSEFLRL